MSQSSKKEHEDGDMDHVAIGVLVKPNGVRGAMNVHPYNADSPLWSALSHFILRINDEYMISEVRSLKRNPKGYVVVLADVSSREEADELRSTEIFVPRGMLPPLEEGEYYHIDLEGSRVVNEHGNDMGVVKRVIEYPAATVLDIQGENLNVEVPLQGPYVKNIDIDASLVTLHDIADLLTNDSKKESDDET